MELVGKLDLRICDCEECSNTQTYREFIREAEEEFCMDNADIDAMNNQELNDYLNFLDDLWCK